MITEYPKISVRTCLPQHKNKPHSELRPASIQKKNAHRGKERPDKNGDGDALYDRTSFRTKQNIA
jgi:hypothetical protein